MATSKRFSSICKLEASLANLKHIAEEKSELKIEHGGSFLDIKATSSRRIVRLQGKLDRPTLQQLMNHVVNARILDARPENRRRSDLTGLTCDRN